MPDPVLRPVLRIEAIGCPILGDDIDTDALIPAAENTRLSCAGYGDALFAAWRYSDIASRKASPSFILNKTPFDQSGILVTGANFGCGSSRESAVWALRDFGIRAVVAESFNETFFRNCIVNRLVPLTACRADLQMAALALEETPGGTVVIDIGERYARMRDFEFPVFLDDYYRSLFLSGETEETMISGLRRQIEARRRMLAERQPWLVMQGPADDARCAAERGVIAEANGVPETS
jgi:3-isopropylmalate/(R)-2-methylmalate dehydratase small subunit